MAKIIFITGGAARGKSRWAVSYFSACDNVLYMCTAPEMDKDISERIRWNNEHNYVEWVVKPGFKMDDAEISEHKFFIYDSIARYTSDTINAMCPDPEKMTDELQKEIEKKIFLPVRIIVPAPRKPIPLITCAPRRTGSLALNSMYTY